MKALRTFEAWLSGLLEDGLGGLLGGGLQPVDIAHRLGEYMEDHSAVGADRRYVPNAYRVCVSKGTMSALAGYQDALQDELAAFLQARAREVGCRFVGRVRVTLVADPEMRSGRMRIEADSVDRATDAGASGAEMTRPIAVGAASGGPPPLLVLVDRRRVPIDPERPLRFGRALDNDVVIDHPTVSRHHAQLLARGTNWWIEDLGSSNGSYVNNGRVTSAFVRAGDSLRLGTVTMLLADPRQAAGR